LVLKLFKNENIVQGIAGGASANFKAGISNADAGQQIEQGFLLPWLIDPHVSWLEYRCWIETHLDAGMALHKPLPQANPTPDDLGTVAIDDYTADFSTKGINMTSTGNFTDVIQRMATSSYYFVLKGYALRVGYKVPIPKIVTVAGVPATPWTRQFATNAIVGNLSGIPLWLAQWDKWYIVSLPPKAEQLPPPNLAMHIRADAELPDGIQAPFSQPDYNAVQTAPPKPPEIARGVGGVGGTGLVGTLGI
jgi:hypothetical protein